MKIRPVVHVKCEACGHDYYFATESYGTVARHPETHCAESGKGFLAFIDRKGYVRIREVAKHGSAK